MSLRFSLSFNTRFRLGCLRHALEKGIAQKGSYIHYNAGAHSLAAIYQPTSKPFSRLQV